LLAAPSSTRMRIAKQPLRCTPSWAACACSARATASTASTVPASNPALALRMHMLAGALQPCSCTIASVGCVRSAASPLFCASPLLCAPHSRNRSQLT
jgi:hypothetical protein